MRCAQALTRLGTLLLGVALVGVGWYAKCQSVLLLLLILAIVSVIVGAFLPALPGAVSNALAGFTGWGETLGSIAAAAALRHRAASGGE